MKIAICFSGKLNENENYNYIDFWKKIINKYNIDVYGSFWTNKNQYKLLNTLNFESVEFEDYNNFKKSTVNLFSIEYNPPSSLNESAINSCKQCTFLPMWYKIWKSNMLSNKKEYNIIVRARLDTYLDDNFEFHINDYLNIPNQLTHVQDWKNSDGPSDLFAYGNSKIMNYYSSLFIYLTSYFKDGVYMYPNEHILKVHLSKKDLTINHCIENIYLRDFCINGQNFIQESKYYDLSKRDDIIFYYPSRII